MIHKPTVLILGAGASCPYGFPTGAELVEKITQLTEQRHSSTRELLRAAHCSDEQVDLLRAKLQKMQFASIDIFLEHHPELLRVGKLAIAATLIPCEIPANLTTPIGKDQHWYRLLYQQLIAGGHFDSGKLSIISLNYDRSLQQYLFDTLQHDLQMSAADAAMAVLKLRFIYLHGQLGDLPWNPSVKDTDRFQRPYQPTMTTEALVGAAGRITIISEIAWERDTRFKRYVESTLREASVIGFLGFGYHEAVMTRLDLWRIVSSQSPELYGCAHGVPEGRQRELQADFPAMKLGTDSALAFLHSSTLFYQGRPTYQITGEL